MNAVLLIFKPFFEIDDWLTSQNFDSCYEDVHLIKVLIILNFPNSVLMVILNHEHLILEITPVIKFFHILDDLILRILRLYLLNFHLYTIAGRVTLVMTVVVAVWCWGRLVVRMTMLIQVLILDTNLLMTILIFIYHIIVHFWLKGVFDHLDFFVLGILIFY